MSDVTFDMKDDSVKQTDLLSENDMQAVSLGQDQGFHSRTRGCED
jgi:hypothetical protein